MRLWGFVRGVWGGRRRVNCLLCDKIMYKFSGVFQPYPIRFYSSSCLRD